MWLKQKSLVAVVLFFSPSSSFFQILCILKIISTSQSMRTFSLLAFHLVGGGGEGEEEEYWKVDPLYKRNHVPVEFNSNSDVILEWL